MIRPRSRSRQQGLSLMALLYVLITLGVILMVAVRAVPVYMNNNAIKSALDGVAADPDLANADVGTLRRALARRLDAGYADEISSHDLSITETAGVRVLSLSYAAERPLFGAMGLVFHFNDTARMGGGHP